MQGICKQFNLAPTQTRSNIFLASGNLPVSHSELDHRIDTKQLMDLVSSGSTLTYTISGYSWSIAVILTRNRCSAFNKSGNSSLGHEHFEWICDIALVQPCVTEDIWNLSNVFLSLLLSLSALLCLRSRFKFPMKQKLFAKKCKHITNVVEFRNHTESRCVCFNMVLWF